MITSRLFSIILVITFCLFCSSFCLAHMPGDYYTVFDEQGKIIMRTAFEVNPGDYYIDSDNKKYKITKINGNKAYAEFIMNVDLAAQIESISEKAGLHAEPDQDNTNRPVFIYHTHSDESYIPSDGTASIPANGGIFEVGDAFEKALIENGAKVLHTRKSHDPHDSEAYDRSRDTAIDGLKSSRPIALFDVHRDAVPAEEYATMINDQPVTKIRIVVGRRNPSIQANNEFALQLKQIVDKKYPGLVKGIYYARGDYNQDLAPRCILLEVGSHPNSKPAAENGIKLFADAAFPLIYANRGGGSEPEKRSSSNTALWIIGIVIAGGILFLILNSGSAGSFINKLKDFRSKEFSDLRGKRGKNDE